MRLWLCALSLTLVVSRAPVLFRLWLTHPRPPCTCLSRVYVNSNTQLSEIVERARKNELSAERVVRRALKDELVDPKAINDCKALESIRYIDMQAIAELTPTQKGCARD